jgi:hypothetical protein
LRTWIVQWALTTATGYRLDDRGLIPGGAGIVQWALTTATGYRLDDRGLIPGGAGDYSLANSVHSGSAVQLASYRIRIGNTFTGSRATVV